MCNHQRQLKIGFPRKCFYKEQKRVGFSSQNYWLQYLVLLQQFEVFKGMSVFSSDFSDYNVYCNLILGYICRITLNFGTLKGGRLLINNLASNNCFSGRNIFQNGVDTLSKIDDAFLTKSWTFHLVGVVRLCSNFASLWHKYLTWNFRQMKFQTSDVSICNKKRPIGTSIFYTDFRVQALLCFHCNC